MGWYLGKKRPHSFAVGKMQWNTLNELNYLPIVGHFSHALASDLSLLPYEIDIYSNQKKPTWHQFKRCNLKLL